MPSSLSQYGELVLDWLFTAECSVKRERSRVLFFYHDFKRGNDGSFAEVLLLITRRRRRSYGGVGWGRRR